MQAFDRRGIAWSECLFADGQGLPMQHLGLLVIALKPSKHRQSIEAFGHHGMLRPEHLLTNGQGLLVEGLRLLIETVKIQKRSGLEEQPRRLRDVELVLHDERYALLDMRQVILMMFGGAITNLRKGRINNSHGPLCPDALSLLIHALLQHGLDERMGTQRARA